MPYLSARSLKLSEFYYLEPSEPSFLRTLGPMNVLSVYLQLLDNFYMLFGSSCTSRSASAHFPYLVHTTISCPGFRMIVYVILRLEHFAPIGPYARSSGGTNFHQLSPFTFVRTALYPRS